MTIATSTGRVQYNGNGATVLFTVPFYFLDNTHLQVVVTSSAGVDSTKVLTTDYTVSGAGNPAGGSITMLSAPAIGEKLAIIRGIPITQTTDLVDNDPLPAEVLETSLDKAAMIDQQLAEKLDRALIMSAGTTVSGQLPDAATRANKLLSFDSSGNPIVTTPSAGTATALATDLAATGAGKGATMVGFIQSGTGAQPRTVEGKLRDVLSLKDFGAVGNGVADDSSAILQALQTAAGKTIKVPAGNYRIASVVTYSGPVSLEGESGSIFTIAGSGQIVLASAPVSIPRHSATLTAGRNSVSFLSAHTLSAGDVFALYNTQDFSWASYRSYYRDGCMFRVDTVTNTTSVKVYGAAPDTYPTAANFLAFKLTGQGVSLKNLTINPSASTASPLVWIDGHVGVVVNNVKIKKGATNTAIELWRCFDTRIKDCDGDVDAGDSYPIILANSQKVTISDCGLYSARHSIAMGGRTGDACVPTRDVLVNHCNLYNSSSNGIGAADVHGNCENIQYSDCYFNTGANVAGANVKFSNCVIVGRDPATYADGNCVFGSEIVKGVFEFEDCRFVCHGDGDTFAGFVDVYVPDRSGSITIRLKDCTGENRAASTTFRCVIIGVGSGAAGTGTIDLDIQNFKLISTVAPFLFVGWAGTANVSSVASTIIDNLAAPSGTFLFGVSNSANNAMPMRMPRLSGKQQITATSGTSSTTGTAQTFRYTYPRVPVAQVTVGSSTAQAYNGNRAVFGLCSQVTASSITPWIESGDQTNWTATRTTDVMWSVEISDL